jgi:hypothetical protein
MENAILLTVLEVCLPLGVSTREELSVKKENQQQEEINTFSPHVDPIYSERISSAVHTQ